MGSPVKKTDTSTVIRNLDNKLSQRFIELDPKGYFLIKLDHASNEIIVEHYSNNITDEGIATDPETGEILKCNNTAPRKPIKIYKGRSAKEIGIKLSEGNITPPLSKLDHALYLGRELQRAEVCLINESKYVQD